MKKKKKLTVIKVYDDEGFVGFLARDLGEFFVCYNPWIKEKYQEYPADDCYIKKEYIELKTKARSRTRTTKSIKMKPQIDTKQIRELFISLKDRQGWNVEKAREEFRFFDMVMKNGLRQKTPIRLDLCDPETIIDCVIEVSSLGLSLNPIKKQAYLVPYGKTCTLMVSYQGEVDYLAAQGVITHADTGSVREKDVFTLFSTQDGPTWKFQKPRTGSRGKIEGAFCVFHLPGGKRKGDYFTNEEITKRKTVAKSGRFWSAWEDEMYIKTAVRMARKGLPSSEAIANLERIDNAHFELDPKFISDERIEDLKEKFAKISKKRQLDSVFNLLNPYEQAHPELQSLFDETEKRLTA